MRKIIYQFSGIFIGKIIAALTLNIVTSTPAKAVVFTTPPNYENIGGTSNFYPLGTDFGNSTFGPNGRWQGIYDDSYFPSPIDINQIRFRVNETNGTAFSTNYSDIQINLSTFTGGQLTSNFANNLGPDNTTVLNRGSITLSSSANNSPRDFDIIIDLDNPFSYDPNNGDLMLEIYNYGGDGGGNFWDVVGTNNTGVICPGNICRAYNLSDINGFATTDFSGLPVAQFSNEGVAPTDVPFESSPTLGLLILGGIFGVNRLRKKQAQKYQTNI